MDREKKKDEGAIFQARTKSSQNSPDFTGNVVLSESLLRKLVDKVKNREDATIRVSAWMNQSREGKRYLKLAVKEDDYMAGAPRQEREGGYPRQDNGYTRPAPPAQRYGEMPRETSRTEPDTTDKDYPGDAPW